MSRGNLDHEMQEYLEQEEQDAKKQAKLLAIFIGIIIISGIIMLII